jgi:arylsulfatase A-like enzyme
MFPLFGIMVCRERNIMSKPGVNRGSALNRIASIRWQLLIRLAAVLILVAATAFSIASFFSQPQYNLLFICVDTLRPDHLGYSGHFRDTSPNIDELAREGLVFERCYSQAGWTLPAMATIFTGRYPKDHGATDFHRRLDHRLPTLASILSERGYDTRGYVSHVILTPRYGLAKGFRKFDYSVLNVGHPHDVATAEQLTDLAIGDLDDIREPFFIWIHYFDPHFEYLVHEKWAHYGTSDIDRYDTEITHTDYQIGRLLQHLNMNGLEENTIVVFTSDHGEEFGEHGGQYHYTLYEEVLRVPLVIRAPLLAAGTNDSVVEQIDLLPTILSMLDIKIDANLPGEDVLRGSSEGPVFVERDRPPPYRQRGVILDNNKLAVIEMLDPTTLPAESRGSHSRVTNVDPGLYLYDLSSDPGEVRNLFDTQYPNVSDLLGILARHFGGGGASDYEFRVEIDDDLRRKLRSLGYLD